MSRLLGLFLMAFVLAAAPVTASADDAHPVWQTLPPEPSLPAATRVGHEAVNGVRLWDAEFGAGEPVLLLHGGLANSNYWGNLVPALVAQHRRVIVLDTRGHGRSTRSDQPYSYDLMASDALALLDRLKVGRTDIVGWSDGGIVGLDIAMAHPERVGRLFAFGANTDTTGLKDDFDKNPVFAAFIERSAQEYRALSPTPDQHDAFVADISRMWASEPHWTDDALKTIHVPVTIADGEHDEGIRQEHNRYMAATIPGAKLVILPGVSHFAMLQDPASFNAAVLAALKP